MATPRGEKVGTRAFRSYILPPALGSQVRHYKKTPELKTLFQFNPIPFLK